MHSLEHGAIVLFYKCASPTSGPECAPLVAGLRQLRDSFPRDIKCEGTIKSRIIIVPDPTIETPVAAAAWGFTYKADCIDTPTLTQFMNENYALGPEDICAAGRAF